MKTPEPDHLSRLMARAIEGDAAAYEQALREFARIVRAYARARVGATLADDVVQEALLTVHRVRHTYDPRRPVRPWLIAVAHSRMVDLVRKARRERHHDAILLTEATEPATPRDSAPRGSLDVEAALGKLTSQQRAVIRMLKFEDKSAAEVAHSLGLSVSNVKVLAHRGYKTIRRLLLGEA